MPESMIEYWNNQPNLRSHKEDSKAYRDAYKYLCYLIDGRFGNRMTINPQCIEINSITEEELNKHWTKEEIRDAIDRFNYMCNSEYSADKQYFPKTFSDFIYNPRTENAFIFSLLGEDRVPFGMKPKILNSAIYEFYKNEYFPGKTETEVENIILIKICNFISREQQKWQNSIGKYYHNHKLKGLGFVRTHKFFINKEYRDRDDFSINYLGQMTWQSYCLYLKKDLKIDIYPTVKQIDEARSKFEDEEEEIKRREEENRDKITLRKQWQSQIKLSHPAERFVERGKAILL